MYCVECSQRLKNHTVKELLQDENLLIMLLTKHDCEYCPLYKTNFCNMRDEHFLCNNAEDEINLCKKYFKNWFNSKYPLKEN
jgi:hypothetical protein